MGEERSKKRARSQSAGKTKKKHNAASETEQAKSTKQASVVIESREGTSSLGLGPDEFMVTVALQDGVKLGLDVDWKDGRTLYVKKVLPGAIDSYNKEHMVRAIEGGDRIIAINGQFDDPKAMLNECKTQRKLELLVRTSRELTTAEGLVPQGKGKTQEAQPSQKSQFLEIPRPVEFIASLEMAEQAKLGIEVDWADGRTLYVKSLSGGAVHEWNRVRPLDYNLQPGTRILAVNGYADSAEKMVSLCKELISAHAFLQLRVQGPPSLPLETPTGKCQTENHKVSKPDEVKSKKTKTNEKKNDKKKDKKKT